MVGFKAPARRTLFRGVVLVGALLLSCSTIQACKLGSQPDLRIGAAISLRSVFPQLVEAWRDIHPNSKVDVTFAASGTIVRQVRGGAPLDVVVLADAHSVDALVDAGDVDGRTRRVVAHNTLVVVAGQSRGDVDPLLALAQLGSNEQLAIGDPAYVPVGRYARAALEAAGLWGTVSDRLVYAPDAAATLAYVGREEANMGIVYATDAKRSSGTVVVGPLLAAEGRPVVVAAAATYANPQAQEFVEFLSGDQARDIFVALGFDSPLP
ncbi:MAG: molybdate transport system substrate-binding protein [Hyphomicrobiaceae bacterium]|jgi:molybdate transport system substrate-binding protein